MSRDISGNHEETKLKLKLIIVMMALGDLTKIVFNVLVYHRAIYYLYTTLTFGSIKQKQR